MLHSSAGLGRGRAGRCRATQDPLQCALLTKTAGRVDPLSLFWLMPVKTVFVLAASKPIWYKNNASLRRTQSGSTLARRQKTHAAHDQASCASTQNRRWSVSHLPFNTFFQSATGNTPYDYQCRLAGNDSGTACHSQLINVPTGLGKTAVVILAWLLNRVVPMRTYRASNQQCRISIFNAATMKTNRKDDQHE